MFKINHLKINNMKLVIEPFNALPCELEVFTINGKKANLCFISGIYRW